MDFGTSPPPVVRPEYALWLAARSIKQNAEAALLGVQPQRLRRYLLPFAHPGRVRPPVDILRIIYRRTGGEITGLHFDPPDLRPPETVSPKPADEDFLKPRNFMADVGAE